MKITKIKITRFRGFIDQEAELGSHITLVTGRNGTQKSILLGLLSQTFTINKNSKMYGEKPLCGGSYRSSFNEKFKLSEVHDKPGTHEWTLYFDDRDPFTVESIPRNKSGGIRFWKKGSRSAGDGYIEFPVIFLSLHRLLPIAETKAQESSETLSTEEEQFFIKNKNKILSTVKEKTSSVSIVSGTSKHTLGTNTPLYDWQQNSSGQDNLGKIISAIISFKRLKNMYPNDYKGGLLVIDELDATMHPVAQEKLFDFLYTQASKVNIQIVLTTHSLSLMKYVCQNIIEQKDPFKKQLKILVLDKKNNQIKIQKGENFRVVKNVLNLTTDLPKEHYLKVFVEDRETAVFARNIIGRSIPIKFEKNTLCCDMYIEILKHKISSFLSKDVIVVLDADAKSKVKDPIQNLFFLPGTSSPERELAKLLYELDEESKVWAKINPDYNVNVCFKDYSFEEINDDREKAKAWFNQQKDNRNWFSEIMKLWKKDNKDIAEKFKKDLETYYQKRFVPSIKI